MPATIVPGQDQESESRTGRQMDLSKGQRLLDQAYQPKTSEEDASQSLVDQAFPDGPSSAQDLETPVHDEIEDTQVQLPGTVPTLSPDQLPPDPTGESNQLAPSAPNEASFFPHGDNSIRPIGPNQPQAAGSLKANPANPGSKLPDAIRKKAISEKADPAKGGGDDKALAKAGLGVAADAIKSGGNMAAIAGSAMDKLRSLTPEQRRALLKKAIALLPPQVKLALVAIVLILALILGIVLSFGVKYLGAQINPRPGEELSTTDMGEPAGSIVAGPGCTAYTVGRFTDYFSFSKAEDIAHGLDPKMEGGDIDPHGAKLQSLDSYLNGDSDYVSLAVDQTAGSPFNQYMQKAYIPSIEQDKKLNPTGKPIVFRLQDTGGAFKGKRTAKVDIAITRLDWDGETSLNATNAQMFVGSSCTREAASAPAFSQNIPANKFAYPLPGTPVTSNHTDHNCSVSSPRCANVHGHRPVLGTFITGNTSTVSTDKPGEAVDLGDPVGTPVYAPFDGTVTLSTTVLSKRSKDPTAMKWMIIIESTDKKYVTALVHLANAGRPAVGTQVKKGQQVGSIGLSHLHFELWDSGSPVNAGVGATPAQIWDVMKKYFS